MKKRVLYILVAVLTFLTVGCVKVKKPDINEFNALVGSINSSRKVFREKRTILKPEYTNWFKDEEDMFTEKELLESIEYTKNYYKDSLILRHDANGNKNNEISYEEAIEDVNTLFKYFRFCYGGYGYFGGDKIFNEVKDNIIKSLHESENITALEFKKILDKNLYFIDDAHFKISINNKNEEFINEKSKIFYVCNNEILIDDIGYYTIKNEDKHYIKAINGDENFEKYIYQSINSEGKLIYNIAYLGNYANSSQEQMDITYKVGDRLIDEKMTLSYSQPMQQNYNIPYDFNIEDSVPILKLNRFYTSNDMDKSQGDFPAAAQEMMKYKTGIIDLRGNLGGRTDAGEQWIKNYSGTKTYPRGAFQYLNSKLMKKMKSEIYGDNTNFNTFEYKRLEGDIGVNISNDNYIFVVVDKYTMSSAEYFIEEIMNMDNVIVVGTNTFGSSICIDLNYYKLEHSDLTCQFGSRLYLSPYSEDFEYTGFIPDILVDSSSAIDKIKMLIKYYNLSAK